METLVKTIVNENGLLKSIHSVQAIAGGSINHTYAVKGKNEDIIFVKINSDQNIMDIFLKESEGLIFLKNTGRVRVPEVLKVGSFQNFQFLVLSYIQSEQATSSHWANMGEAVSELHKKTSSFFGFDHDNFIGALSQRNEYCTDWIDFFISRRLEPQLRRAGNNSELHQLSHKFEILYKRLPELLAIEAPSLLHGDLWYGNVIAGRKFQPYFIDPAVYFGNREIEIAFTTLFGGFSEVFYNTYLENFPMTKGYEERFEIYNLYPLMVHHNLFGGHYWLKIQSTLKKYAR